MPTLYHTTPSKNLPSIRRRGLVPHHPTCECHEGIGKVVWLTKQGLQPGERGPILQVDIAEDDPRLLPSVGDDGWWIYRGIIPPDRIKVIEAEP